MEYPVAIVLGEEAERGKRGGGRGREEEKMGGRKKKLSLLSKSRENALLGLR